MYRKKLYLCDMKSFKKISTAFIVIIALIFGCNVYYLASLYNSIKNSVERDVKAALSEADLDELWLRAEFAKAIPKTQFVAKEGVEEHSRHGEVSVGREASGNMTYTTRHADGSVITRNEKWDGDYSFTSKIMGEVGKQFHAVMDSYVPVNLHVLDSLLVNRLRERFIYPEFVSTEVVDSAGKVIMSNQDYMDGDYDSFYYCFKPDEKMSYRVYMTPITHHILSEMAGVIITVFLLMISFALAFWYLLRTVSKLRTIEEMKDDFVSNMTHELKTPIAIAYSANDALLNYDTRNDPAKKETYLKIANKQLKKLGELVEGILAMSMERRKTMQLRPEPIQMRPFLEEIAAAQRMRSEKDIEIQVSAEDSLIIEADKTHLANVLNNLIDNAIKYSGDSVLVSIRCTPNGLTVADTGIGIPARAIPFLFNKFYRVPHGNRQDVRGYGIGLYYVKSILDKMGWSISVSSKEGEGSMFNIKFSVER